jgi:hypothetical protein
VACRDLEEIAMKLGLSSAVAPDLSLQELAEACARRGLGAIEMVIGEGNTPAAALCLSLETALGPAPGAEPLLAGILWDRLEAPGFGDALKLAASAGVPLVVRASTLVLAAPPLPHHAAEGTLLLLHEGPADGIAGLIQLRDEITAASGWNVEIGWQVDPRRDGPARMESVLSEINDRLRYIRLLGGGPEALGQTGQGIGNLVGRLALLRYGGPLILSPSDHRLERAWAHWLGHRAGWGCGSKGADPSLVTFSSRST